MRSAVADEAPAYPSQPRSQRRGGTARAWRAGNGRWQQAIASAQRVALGPGLRFAQFRDDNFQGEQPARRQTD
jgi:hypothetical protein